MAEKPRYQNHPERVRPTIRREHSLGGRAVEGFNFSPDHGTRIITDAEMRQRHLEQLVLHGQEEAENPLEEVLEVVDEEPEFRRSTDTPPTKFEIDANGITFEVGSDE